MAGKRKKSVSVPSSVPSGKKLTMKFACRCIKQLGGSLNIGSGESRKSIAATWSAPPST